MTADISREIKIAPIQWMADLREGVLANSEKRMPKWRFRIASDLLVSIQPKPVALLTPRAIERGYKQRLLNFEGRSVMAEENATADMLEGKVAPGIVRWRMNFEIDAVTSDEWMVHRRGWSWTRGAGSDGCHTAFKRTVHALSTGFFDGLTEEKLLSHFCFCCGKALTDPASMARRIGPECFGSSSVRVPFTIEARP
jgi:Family of unknown function (DUF6011)